MRVEIDEDKCCGAGSCVLSAPDVFDQRESDGVVMLLMERPGEEYREALEEAAERCPAAAITLLEQ